MIHSGSRTMQPQKKKRNIMHANDDETRLHVELKFAERDRTGWESIITMFSILLGHMSFHNHEGVRLTVVC